MTARAIKFYAKFSPSDVIMICPHVIKGIAFDELQSKCCDPTVTFKRFDPDSRTANGSDGLANWLVACNACAHLCPEQLRTGYVEAFYADGRLHVADWCKRPADQAAPVRSHSEAIPRRVRIDLMSSGELAIHRAVAVVEEMGADVRLTDAVILLAQARERVADFVDGIADSANAPTPLPVRTAEKSAHCGHGLKGEITPYRGVRIWEMNCGEVRCELSDADYFQPEFVREWIDDALKGQTNGWHSMKPDILKRVRNADSATPQQPQPVRTGDKSVKA